MWYIPFWLAMFELYPELNWRVRNFGRLTIQTLTHRLCYLDWWNPQIIPYGYFSIGVNHGSVSPNHLENFCGSPWLPPLLFEAAAAFTLSRCGAWTSGSGNYLLMQVSPWAPWAWQFHHEKMWTCDRCWWVGWCKFTSIQDSFISFFFHYIIHIMGVSINGGTPKSSICT